MTFRAVLFDLDGTLVDSRRDIAQGVNHTLSFLNRPSLSVDQVENMVGDGVRQLLERAAGPLSTGEMERALAVFLPYYLEHCTDFTRLYPGVMDALQNLSGMSMGVITNKPAAHTEKTLRVLKIRHCFREVLAGDSLPTRKPSPEPLWEALRRMDVLPAEALMVGDSPMDIEAARSAKVLVAAVTYGFRREEELRRYAPDYMLGSLTELRSVLS